MEAKEQFKQLDLSNAFLFSLAFSDPEACALVLQVILQKPVYKVRVQPEKSILYSKEFRSVRLDVYARDSMEVEYDLEMQNEDQGNLPLRSRFYQAEMDAAALKPGEDFKRLSPSYVIFICAFDPFGEGYYRYTFENRCLETGKPLGDGTCKIFLNTRGTRPEGVPEELIHFLQYLENSTDEFVQSTQDETVAKLHKRVTWLKEDRRWEAKYMTFEEMLQRKMDDGLRQGIQEGVQRGIAKGITEGIALTKRVLRLSAQGMSAAEISAQCGISQAEVADILNMNE